MTRTILVLVAGFFLLGCSTDAFTGGDGGDGGIVADDGGALDSHVIMTDASFDAPPSDDADPSDGGGADAVAEAEAGPPPPKRVFISSKTTQSNFGGLAQADAICQSAAAGAGLSGTYKAWLSTSGVNASTRLSHSSVPYVLVDGTVVASDWNGLVSGAPLKSAIDLDESGLYIPYDSTTYSGCTWTGSTAGGGYSGETCGDWTVSEDCTTVAYDGTSGIDSLSSAAWTTGGVSGCCTVQSYAFYCFEQ